MRDTGPSWPYLWKGGKICDRVASPESVPFSLKYLSAYNCLTPWKMIFKGTGYTWSFFATFSKGDNFCDFLYAFLLTCLILKTGSMLKERIRSNEVQFISFREDPFSERRHIPSSDMTLIHHRLNVYATS